MTYAYDNYTNEGIQSTLALTKDLMIQLGVTVGTEAAPWHLYQKAANPFPNPLYPSATFYKDPGAQPSFTACVRYGWNDGKDDVNACADALNDGQWGYNNLQWYGFTYYHKWNDQWHISYELYYMNEKNVPNANNSNALAIVGAGGTPFSPQFIPFN